MILLRFQVLQISVKVSKYWHKCEEISKALTEILNEEISKAFTELLDDTYVAISILFHNEDIIQL